MNKNIKKSTEKQGGENKKGNSCVTGCIVSLPKFMLKFEPPVPQKETVLGLGPSER